MTGLTSPPAAEDTPALFVFQAKGVQSFVLRTDKLRDTVGATDLVDGLARETLAKTLAWLGLEEERDWRRLSAAAGAARLRFRKLEQAHHLARWWPMVCAYAAPGLEFVWTVQPWRENYLATANAAEQELAAHRNLPRALLPELGPPVLRAQRTGAAAVERTSVGAEREEIDLATRAKRLARRQSRQDAQSPEKFPEICRRLGFPPERPVPTMMDQIAGRERAPLAIVHADGNGLGTMFIRLEKALEGTVDAAGAEVFYTELSSGLIRAGDAAAQAAVEKVRARLDDRPDQPWPLLPIVLAGDDLTAVMRGDLAVDFTECFLQAFELKTGELFRRLRGDFPALPIGTALPDRLSAGAGIVWVRSRFPFALGYRLCEQLAGLAKKAAKQAAGPSDAVPASTLAFHAIAGGATPATAEELHRQEYRGAGGLHLTMAPYAVTEGPGGFPTLAALGQLRDALRAAPAGRTRELLTLLHESRGRAEKHFARLLAAPERQASAWQTSLGDAFAALLGEKAVCHAGGRTPLADALTWLGVEPKSVL